MKILIVEDDRKLSEYIKEKLNQKGFKVECAFNGITGLDYASTGIFDLMILDVMMPGMDGFEVARSLRSSHFTIPILMVTARSTVEDRITGLEAGADYYLTKPFDIRELMACINALLRRQGGQIDELCFGNTTLSLGTGILKAGNTETRLSDREFDVMRLLLQAGEKNMPKEQLLLRVWGYDSNATENHVEVYVGKLRKILESLGSDISIEAVRRLGYHLEIKK